MGQRLHGQQHNDGREGVQYRPLRQKSDIRAAVDFVDEEKAVEYDDRSNYLVGNGSLDRRGRLADRSRTGGWKAAPIIFGTELAERIGSLGLQRNLVMFLTTKMNISNVNAANMVSNFTGAVYLTPFIGGFVADASLGRFWVIVVFGIIQVMGMVLLTFSAVLPALRPPACQVDSNPCLPAQGMQLAVLLIGIYLIALGNGGIKPNISSIGADQFDETEPKEKKKMSHFFNWYYFCVSIGSLISVTLVVYIEDNVGFGWGFGIPTVIFAGAIVMFIGGAPLYRYKLPGGSPVTSIVQVVVAAFRKRNLTLPQDDDKLYEVSSDDPRYLGSQKFLRSNQFRLLDKAAVIPDQADENDPLSEFAVNPWELCTVTQVEELKMIISLLPIWVSTTFVWTALSQMETFSVEAATTMDRQMGLNFKFPAASLAVFELVNVLCILPLYDIFFVPFMRKFTGNMQGISTLQRIGVGIVVSILAMLVAGLVEQKRVSVARENGLIDKPDSIIPLSVFWLVPQYFFRGTTEIFTQVGQLDFFYSESPESMRSLGTAMYLGTIGAGHFVSTLLVTMVNVVTQNGDNDPGWLTPNLNESRLDKFYFLLAGLSFINFFFYLLCAHWYKYKTVINIEGPLLQTQTTSVSAVS